MKYRDNIYYSNEDEEVSNYDIEPKIIDDNYKYVRKNIIYKFFAWFTYRVIMTPIVWFWFKVIRRTKYVNRKALKKVKGGYFVYSNHVEQHSDAFGPAMICFPNKPYLVCNADNVSMPVLKHFTPMWGALPLPDTVGASKNFARTIEVVAKNNPVIIYPEAHLWQYYTGIRYFSDKSFRYPVNMNKPIFVFTTTFVRRKEGKKPKIVTYVDGPFYPDETLPRKDRQKVLRDVAYNTMLDRSKNSNYQYVTYIKEQI